MIIGILEDLTPKKKRTRSEKNDDISEESIEKTHVKKKRVIRGKDDYDRKMVGEDVEPLQSNVGDAIKHSVNGTWWNQYGTYDVRLFLRFLLLLICLL